MFEVIVPHLNANDEKYIFLKWLVPDEADVQKDDPIAVIEGAKSAVDLLAPQNGKLHQRAKPDEEFGVGETVGAVLQAGEHCVPTQSKEEHSVANDFQLTKAAQVLVDKHHVATAQLASIGKKVIKAKDIERLIKKLNEEKPNLFKIPLQQRQIAKTVALSHSTIPTSFLLMKIECNTALEQLQDLTEAWDSPVGLPELLISILHQLFKSYPLFFSSLVDNETLEIPDVPGIGITLDLDAGLYVPIIRFERPLSLSAIADEVMEMKVRAFRGEIPDHAMQNGNITVALAMENGCVTSIPIIYPGQTCIVSLSSVQEEVALRDDGVVYNKKMIHLGLAYDHRVINGAQASQFLGCIKEKIEHFSLSPATAGANTLAHGE